MELKSLYFNLVYVFSFSAKTRICINKHTQIGAENALFPVCLTITEPFSPFYLEEMKVLSFSRTVNQLIMQVHKPKVEYKLALQEKPQGSILTYYYKTNYLTRINWLNTRLIIASNKIRHEIPFKTKRVKYTAIWKKSIKTVKESKSCFTYPSPFSILFPSSIFSFSLLLHNFIIFPPQCFYSLLQNFYYFPSSMFFIPLLHPLKWKPFLWRSFPRFFLSSSMR